MICPRCSVGEISESSQECLVCGYSPTGGVVVEAPAWNDLEDPSVRSLERQFRVEGVLRRGTVSSVYLARDTVSGRLTALKVLPLALQHSHDLPERFKAEAALAAALDHPHVVPVYHFGVSDACLWYTMEYCQTRSLGELLRASGPIELRACLRLVEQVASALDYGHRRGVLHGNLKLSNVLVDADGWARVTDFGMLTALGPLPPRRPDASIEENYGHVAPERFGPSPIFGPASDQYSLAVLTFACLAGRQPITGDTVDEIARGHVQGTAPRLSDARASVPPHVTAAVGRGMSKKPAERFPTILDYSTALAGVGLPRYSPLPMPMPVPEAPRRTPAPAATPLLLVEGDPDDDLPPLRPTPRRRWTRWILTTAAIAVVAVAYWWWHLPQSSEPSTASQFQTSAPLGPDSTVGRGAADSQALAPAPAPVGSTTVNVPAGSTRVASQPAVRTPSPTPQRRLPPTVTQTQPPPRHVAPPPVALASGEPGRLFVNATPWGELTLDGQPAGNTPKVDLPVAPGTHVLRVARDGFEPFERTITIRAGETLRITDIVLKPTP